MLLDRVIPFCDSWANGTPLAHRVHGARYHVMNRGGRREPIFRGDSDRELFLECLDQPCAKTGWRIHAYWLMPNHFHLALETPERWSSYPDCQCLRKNGMNLIG